MGIWITLGVLTLLAILPLGIRVLYDAKGPVVQVVLGLIKLTVYPRQKKDGKTLKKEKIKAPKKGAFFMLFFSTNLWKKFLFFS